MNKVHVPFPTAQTRGQAGATLAFVKNFLSSPASASAPMPPIDFGGSFAVRALRVDMGLCDQQFVDMLNAYRHSGGLARADELVALLQCRADGAVSAVARWIVDRSVICFDWQAQLWVPLFQFEGPEMTLGPHLGAVFQELRGVFDPWELARWFVLANRSLDGRSPVDVLRRRPGEVVAAARTDRFIVDG